MRKIEGEKIDPDSPTFFLTRKSGKNNIAVEISFIEIKKALFSHLGAINTKY